VVRVDIDYWHGGRWHAVNIEVGDCNDGLTMVMRRAVASVHDGCAADAVGWDADSPLDLPHSSATEMIDSAVDHHPPSGDHD